MSLGLGDINKKQRSSSKKKSESKGSSAKSSSSQTSPSASGSKDEKYPPGAWARSRTARPWTDSGLSRSSSRNRPRVDASDLVMNEEWLSTHAEPLFWIDLSKNSQVAAIHERLVNLENKVQNAIHLPLRILKLFLPSKKK